jgi:hypothetical protein
MKARAEVFQNEYVPAHMKNASSCDSCHVRQTRGCRSKHRGHTLASAEMHQAP